jgi:hypothetical protein
MALLFQKMTDQLPAGIGIGSSAVTAGYHQAGQRGLSLCFVRKMRRVRVVGMRSMPLMRLLFTHGDSEGRNRQSGPDRIRIKLCRRLSFFNVFIHYDRYISVFDLGIPGPCRIYDYVGALFAGPEAGGAGDQYLTRLNPTFNQGHIKSHQ